MNDWQKNTIYRHYTKNSKQIQWFWQVGPARAGQGRVSAGLSLQPAKGNETCSGLKPRGPYCVISSPISDTLLASPHHLQRRGEAQSWDTWSVAAGLWPVHLTGVLVVSWGPL